MIVKSSKHTHRLSPHQRPSRAMYSYKRVPASPDKPDPSVGKDTISYHNMLWNDQCVLFSRLHYDVRVQVYRQLFGNSMVHVYQEERRTSAVGNTDWFMTNAGCVETNCAHWRDGDECKNRGRISTNFLFSCKRAFQEGLPILYATNRISFDSPRDFAYFGIYSQENLFRVRYLDFAIRAYCGNHSGCTELKRIFEAIPNRIPFATNVRVSVTLHSNEKHDRDSAVSQVSNDVREVMQHLRTAMETTEVKVELVVPEILVRYFKDYVEKDWSRFDLKMIPDVKEAPPVRKSPRRKARERSGLLTAMPLPYLRSLAASQHASSSNNTAGSPSQNSPNNAQKFQLPPELEQTFGHMPGVIALLSSLQNGRR
ncbi:hypothetical protein BGZ63DRAFT_435160 [Mariannaea sp. PMI_226]|nr:hypothetical protein BGZ63DRAFT_435160 [Mariannaea sp. PMI_226]